MKTARPRFGLNEDGTLYDHKSGKTHPPRGTLTDGAHVYQLAEVASGIAKGEYDAGHYRSLTPPVAAAGPKQPVPPTAPAGTKPTVTPPVAPAGGNPEKPQEQKQ